MVFNQRILPLTFYFLILYILMFFYKLNILRNKRYHLNILFFNLTTVFPRLTITTTKYINYVYKY